ncbi:MAG: hypothetical protein P4M00_05210 [Azospirillaceae bacterium]|nr:hypothetical protein [Azospirillaceae bacterium]
MMTAIEILASGNALRLILQHPDGALFGRILRRTADQFTGPDDAGAVCVDERVFDGGAVVPVVDVNGLINGVTYYYRAFTWDGQAWTTGSSLAATPEARYRGDAIDPQTLLRDRIAAGLAVEVQRRMLHPKSGRVPVLTAPYGAQSTVPLPVVTVQLIADRPWAQAVGDVVGADHVVLETNAALDTTVASGVGEARGTLRAVVLNVTGTALNADERIALRCALARVIQVNEPVFDAFGLKLIEFSQEDSEEIFQKNAPLFLTKGHFSCVVPRYLTGTVPRISAVDVAANGIGGDFVTLRC